MQVEVGGWMILPMGTNTRYFDTQGSCYRLKFLPFMNIFTKSESVGVASFAKRMLIDMSKEFLDLDVNIATAGFDASDAFRTGLSAGMSYFTDWAHVARKLKEELGLAKLINKGNIDYFASALDVLHLCSTQGQFDSLATVVLDRLLELGETDLKEYLTKTGSGYFVAPWNKWFSGAPRYVLPDGNFACVPRHTHTHTYPLRVADLDTPVSGSPTTLRRRRPLSATTVRWASACFCRSVVVRSTCSRRSSQTSSCWTRMSSRLCR